MTGILTPTIHTPRSGEDVGRILRLAARQGSPLVPRSSTGSARLGRGTPVGDESLLDLSGLRRIVRMDRRNRVALVEAGVTFGELSKAVAGQGMRLMHPLLPLPGKSALAGFLDREPTLVPKYHWDLTDPLLCAELWFGTGDRFRTGGAAGPGDTLEDQWAAGMHQKNPLGPAQTDLLKVVQGAQGTMGVATWGSVKLEVTPELTSDHVVTAGDLRGLAGFVHGVTRVRVCDEILVFDRECLRALGRAVGIAVEVEADWAALVRIGSLPNHAEESMAFQEADARALALSSGVDMTEASTSVPDGLFDAVLGAGTDHAWKLPGTHRDVQFIATLDDVTALSRVIRDAWSGHGLDPASVGTYVQPLDQGRLCHVESTAFLDGVEPAVADAIDSDLEYLAGLLATRGAFFSRPAPALSGVAYGLCPDTVAALDKVKDVLDPDEILAPGRLWARGRR